MADSDAAMLVFERKARKKGFRLILGLDEAGRGPLAGPVVAAAVALKAHHFLHSIRDSKKMTAGQRSAAFPEIMDKAFVGIGIISEAAIDSLDISSATFIAMTNAVNQLLSSLASASPPPAPDKICLLVDGKYFRSDLPYPVRTIVDGDNLSLSIACASVIAKVTRDRILDTYDRIFPAYGFRQHKGYPTLAHRRAIRRFGFCPIHRRTFDCHL